MKITAGMGSIDDYIPFVEAGVDEVFIGYVPEWWSLKYRNSAPLNRREVLFYNVQIGSFSELQILSNMVKDYHVPVSITINALTYLPEQYDEIIKVLEECLSVGFHSFIIADTALLVYLQENPIIKKIHITLSGENSEVNSKMVSYMQKFSVERIIFERKNTLEEMKHIIDNNPKLEYEAFVLNEMCHYHGAFCFSLHSDELCHMCLIPYTSDTNIHKELPVYDEYIPGKTGCALCSLWKLEEAGVNVLKLVSRGNYGEETVKDIQAIRKALQILENSNSEEEYITTMRKELFPHGCSKNCYYNIKSHV